MRIAVASEDGNVSSHFGHCPEFILVDLENNAVANRQVVPSPPHEPGKMPLFLKEHGVEVVVTGGMGQKAAAIFDQHGIKQIVGVAGSVEDVITGCLDGTLKGGGGLCAH